MFHFELKNHSVFTFTFKFAVIFLMSVVFAGHVQAQRSGIIINEFMYDAPGGDPGNEWIEIVNTAGEAIDMTGYDLRCGEAGFYTFPVFTLQPGTRVTVHIDLEGTDSETDLYTGFTSQNMSNSHDSAVLFNSTSHTTGTIVDFIQYGEGGQSWEGTAVSAGIWTEGAYVEIIPSGNTLGLCPDGSDNNSVEDWYEFDVPTMGGPNDCPQATPTAVPSPTSGPEPTVTPEISGTPEPTPTPTQTSTSTGTPTMSFTPSPPTLTAPPTLSPTATETFVTTPTPSATADVSPTSPPTSPPTPPTQTPTGSITATHTPITPSPTSTSNTPSPTLTPENPTAVPTPTALNYGPDIWAAGYVGSYLDESAGGSLSIMAVIADPDGDPVKGVSLYYEGQPAGVTEEFDTQESLIIWEYGPLDLPAGIPYGEFLLELAAWDEKGETGTLWPYLNSGSPDISPHSAPWYAGEFSSGNPESDPIILMAGYRETRIENGGGQMTLIALVSDPQGLNDVTLVELYAGGAPTGILLYDDGESGDFDAGDGVFGYVLELEEGALDEGIYLLELAVRDAAGHQSDLWPYVTIHKSAPPTPAYNTPTPTPTQPDQPQTPTPVNTFVPPTPINECIQAEPRSFDFGLVWINESGPSETVCVIQNNCNYNVQLSVNNSNPDNFLLEQPAECLDQCTLQQNSEPMPIIMKFTPKSCNLITGALELTFSAPNQPLHEITISLSGTGRCL